MPILTVRQYGAVFLGIMALLGVAVYLLKSAPALSREEFVVQEPSDTAEINDEFLSLRFTFTPSSLFYGSFAEGNFLLLLTPIDAGQDGAKATPVSARIYPREIPKLTFNDGENVVRFGEKGFAMDETHSFSGYAYISPSDVFDGEYSARILYVKTEEGRSPKELGQSPDFRVTVKRTFNLQHSLIVAQLPTDVRKKGLEWPLMTLNIRAVSGDVAVRALELGTPSVRRVSDAITSLALYDAETGELLSTLTDTKISAATLERYTVYVLDTPLVANAQFTRSIEVRAVIDEVLLQNDPLLQFALVRLYGVNTDKQKIAESVADIGVRVQLPQQ